MVLLPTAGQKDLAMFNYTHTLLWS